MLEMFPVNWACPGAWLSRALVCGRDSLAGIRHEPTRREHDGVECWRMLPYWCAHRVLHAGLAVCPSSRDATTSMPATFAIGERLRVILV